MESDLHAFRIIVVGGGPVGLTAAHILSKAGFDYVILEKYNTVTPDVGNALGLWPQTTRVMDQLGLYDALQALAVPLSSKICLTQQGRVFSRTKAFGNTVANHGYAVNLFHRHSFLSALYDSLSETDKARIKVNKHVTRIETFEPQPDNDSAAQPRPVRVICADGTVEDGDIVIGADGVHSTVRELMLQQQQVTGDDGEEKVSPTPSVLLDARTTPRTQWKTTYRTLFASIRRAHLPAHGAGIATGDTYESHGPGTTTQLFVGHDMAWLFVYSRLMEVTPAAVSSEQEFVRSYTQRDADEYAAALGHIHIAPGGLLLREFYADKEAAGLTDLQEGVVADGWSWGGRAVLVGDAVHKMTPNLGWGYNSGVHDLVVLVNALRGLLSQPKKGPDDNPPATAPTSNHLQVLFSSYATQRAAQAAQICNISGKYTRICTWTSPYRRLLSRRIIPAIEADSLLVTYALGNHIRKIPVLDWLEESRFAGGSIAWTHGRSGERGRRGVVERCKWWVIGFVMPGAVALL